MTKNSSSVPSITHSDYPEQERGNHEQTNLFSHSVFRDNDYLIGLICLAASLTIFAITVNKEDFNSALSDSSFILNYFIALFYSILLLVNGKMRFFWKAQQKEFQPHRLLLWFIWLISCFGLNRLINIFNPSPIWLSVAIFISAGTSILYATEKFLPQFFQKLLYFLLGFSTILWAYYSIYLSRLYPISVLAFIFLGLSFHSFVPLLLLITHLRIIYQNWKKRQAAILAGLLLPTGFIIYFCIQWYIVSNDLQKTNNNAARKTESELPFWVSLGQTIGDDWITERIIKGDLVYQVPKPTLTFFPDNNNLGELSQHDPLVFMASLFGPKLNLEHKDRLKLLDVLFDTRHNTQERLWMGNYLKTETVKTEVKIFPEYRLAYTEKTISIKNQGTRVMAQEALYSFYLPNGSVVSSLSLWIEGKEQPGYLTSQTKADSAYKTIVGVENRDPSVIHWQEGSVVKVKVFPCTSDEDRRFKIGITSPLRLNKDQLIYENIYFKGPASNEAQETTSINFTQPVDLVDIPVQFARTSQNGITSKGFYKPSWEVSFDSVALASKGFEFNKKHYSVSSLLLVPERADIKNIFLDINNSWTEDEFWELYPALNNKAVYVYDNGFVLLTRLNHNVLLKDLLSKRYSVFPIHKVPNIRASILITKGTFTSPNLHDIRGTAFGDSLRSHIDKQTALRTFNIGEELSPYFKTLNELRMIRCEKTSLIEIKKMIINNQFPQDFETESAAVRIDDAKMVIRETSQIMSSSAPDHLLRLYAYNHIMKQIGRQYLSQDYLKASALNSNLITEAEQANIVTPISSLVVLESKADYKRFDIKKSKNSLDNASLKQSGAVPEPQEWALIALFALLISYYTFRNYAK